ncbi:MAG: hypothetical protein NZV14_11810 [Bryobacteraceae bacterium]|nr:hypothetical protein [Bryobacteraceae bacterium]MDW8378839.1 hypothetical protein [Bryobacterales bacterium]
MEKIDPNEFRKRRDELYRILEGIARHADQQSQGRCPYKNRYNQCTASFGCRNQRKPTPPESKPRCVGDDKLNYRGAWVV